jgi:hypothetical protein
MVIPPCFIQLGFVNNANHDGLLLPEVSRQMISGEVFAQDILIDYF